MQTAASLAASAALSQPQNPSTSYNGMPVSKIQQRIKFFFHFFYNHNQEEEEKKTNQLFSLLIYCPFEY